MEPATLVHHQNAWTCRECGIAIPILDGWGAQIQEFHRMKHVIEKLGAANRAYAREAQEQRARAERAEQLANDLATVNQKLNQQLQSVFVAVNHASKGFEVTLQ
jgi:hypothetical protein